MIKVSAEIASKEVNNWLDYKRIFEKAKLESRESIDLLEDMVSEGVLTIDEDSMVITHNLLFPIGSELITEKLTYKPRINDVMLQPYMKGVKATDGDARLTGYVCALTEQPKGIIRNMDSQDKKISIAIAIFFL